MVTKIKYCPRCKSSNIVLYAGGALGTYHCLDCGYIGSLIIEKDIFKTMDEKPKKKNKDIKKIQKK